MPTKILGFIVFAFPLDVLNVEIVIIPFQIEKIMQYFQAVQKGKQIANKSQMKMFEVAGFAMLTLTTKKVDGKFQPVGEEEFTAVISSADGHVAVIVDKDGFTKAQSKAVEKEEAISIYKKLREAGILEYPEKEIQIWSETRPTIQNNTE
jgi:translation elongation factor P/translation initiation factor 5A